MTRPNDPEHDLLTLFDTTAEQPSTHQLTRMAARATDVPQRRPRWAQRWLLWLAPALAAAGALGLAVALSRPSTQTESAAVLGQERPATAAAPTRLAVQTPTASAAGAPSEEPEEPLDPSLTALLDDERSGHDALFGPVAEDDEAWYAATAAFLGE